MLINLHINIYVYTYNAFKVGGNFFSLSLSYISFNFSRQICKQEKQIIQIIPSSLCILHFHIELYEMTLHSL